MGFCPPRLALAPRTPDNQQLASGVGVSTPCGAVSTRGITVFASNVLELYIYRRISDLGMGPYLPRVALAPRTQPISNQSVGLGFKHYAGRYRPGGLPFSSPVCSRCNCMEGFIIRGWDPIIFHLPRVALTPRTLANQQSGSRVGGSTPCGAVSTPATTRFRPRWVGVAGIWNDF